MTLAMLANMALLAVVAAAALTDLRAGKVPNGLTYPAIVLGLALGGVSGGWWGLGASATGLAIAFVPLFLFYRLGAGLGGGDVKLMAAVGSLGGTAGHLGGVGAWFFVVVAMLYSFIVAAVLGIVIMVWQGKTRATLGRIGRTLGSALLPGAKVVSPASPESVQVPFAVCVCLGVAWAMIEMIRNRSLWDVVRQWL